MKFRFWHFSSNLTVNTRSCFWCFFHLLVHVSDLLCRATLAFSSGKSFTVAPAAPWSANLAGGLGFPENSVPGKDTGLWTQAWLCFQTYWRFFTWCSYQCYCGLNGKLHTGGDGRTVFTSKGRLFSLARIGSIIVLALIVKNFQGMTLEFLPLRNHGNHHLFS